MLCVAYTQARTHHHHHPNTSRTQIESPSFVRLTYSTVNHTLPVEHYASFIVWQVEFALKMFTYMSKTHTFYASFGSIIFGLAYAYIYKACHKYTHNFLRFFEKWWAQEVPLQPQLPTVFMIRNFPNWNNNALGCPWSMCEWVRKFVFLFSYLLSRQPSQHSRSSVVLEITPFWLWIVVMYCLVCSFYHK